jgi:hypothetical protein
MSEKDRAAIIRELARKTVVYRPAGIDAVPAPREFTYRSAGGSALPMCVYFPLLDRAVHAPVVLLPLAYPDPEGRFRTFGPVTSWARLCARSGIAAVIYGTETPHEDVHAALRHLVSHAEPYGLDTARLGVLATSANVTVALSLLMRGERVRCAALLYGYTFDLEGSTTVTDMSRQFGFVDACHGRSVQDLPGDVQLLVVRAGQDRFPGLNDALDRMIAGALSRNLPLTLINHAAGGHAFDVDEDTDTSRGIIRLVLAFLRSQLAVSGSEDAVWSDPAH